MSDARAEIMGRVQRAQGSSLQQLEIDEALAEIGPAPIAPLDAEDPLQAFLIRLGHNRISIESVSDRTVAVQQISERVYQRYHSRKVVAGYDPRLAAMPWRDGKVLVRFGAAANDDPVAISYAKLAIAESGSLVLFNNRGNPASNNWLVQDHIILLDPQDLVADFEMAWQRIRELQVQEGSSRSISFISGPSSTADIKFHTVYGAHGPFRVHLVYIGELPSASPDQAGS